MQTKTFSIKRNRDSEPRKLERPHPQTAEEMGSLCQDPDNGPRSLAISAWVVNLQNAARADWNEQIENGAFEEGSEQEAQWLQTFVDNYKYGGGRGRAAGPTVVDLSGIDVPAELLERLKAQNVVASGTE